jgi:hypothetical protein
MLICDTGFPAKPLNTALPIAGDTFTPMRAEWPAG